ncbi:hypothetical protein [Clostridium pasteurianum]
MEESSWVKELKEKRGEYGISQNKLAVAAGITRCRLSSKFDPFLRLILTP